MSGEKTKRTTLLPQNYIQTPILYGGMFIKEPSFPFIAQWLKWHVCQMMRLIYEVAETPGEVERRKEEMVRYMAWRSPDTLKAYEHYFQTIRHAQMQDVLHQQLDEKLKSYMTQTLQKRTASQKSTPQPTKSDKNVPVSNQEVGWGDLLAAGGMGND